MLRGGYLMDFMLLSRKILALASLALLGGGIAWITLRPVELPSPTRLSTTASSSPASETIPAARGDHREAIRTTEELAGVQPDEALDAALKIPNRKRQLAEILRLLNEWAARAPSEAFEWACSQEGALRRPAILAVLAGAGEQPQTEFQLGSMLKHQDPQEAEDDGLAAIQALDNEKHFEAAIQLTNAISSDARSSWIVTIFRAWGTSEPRGALQALGTMDPALREEIFHVLSESWSTSQPADLASYAISLPVGKERSEALAAVADHWSRQDPAEMANWLAEAPHTPDLDPAVAAMVMRSDGANRPTAIAIAWTETIIDPKLRFTAMKHLMREWRQADLVAAQTYVQSTPWLTPQQRDELSQITNALQSASNDFGEE